jgi:hypothetical protein
VQSTETTASVSLSVPGTTKPKAMGLADTEQAVSMVALTSKLPVLVSACARAEHSSKSNGVKQRKLGGTASVFIGDLLKLSNSQGVCDERQASR